MKTTLLYSFLTIISVAVSISSTVAQSSGLAFPIITEIMYNPPESGIDSLEFIEIYNPNSGNAIDLSGYYFSEGIVETIHSGVSIPANGRIILAGDSAAFEGTYGVACFEWNSDALSNNGEDLVLREPGGFIADSVNYNNTGAWPGNADGEGYSLVLCDPSSDNSLAENWTSSENATGTLIATTPDPTEIYADPGMASTCTTVGIADNNIITTVVYPNPTEGAFTMKFAALENAGMLRVFNSIGQVVYSESIAGGTSRLDINTNLKSGFYTLSLENGKSVSRKSLIVE